MCTRTGMSPDFVALLEKEGGSERREDGHATRAAR